jgi:hypothetical protein
MLLSVGEGPDPITPSGGEMTGTSCNQTSIVRYMSI